MLRRDKNMITLLDNKDSFSDNLARMLRLAGGGAVRVVRSDAVRVEDLRADPPAALVLSPGPGRPDGAGICVEAAATLEIPILGVCLGHQCIAAAFGGEAARAERPLHGRAAEVTHRGDTLFSGLGSPFPAGRYHALIARLPEALEPIAWSAEGEVMACRHRTRPVWGVQFHPESLLTPGGPTLLRNFLALAGLRRAQNP